jgi:hypothetical protein
MSAAGRRLAACLLLALTAGCAGVDPRSDGGARGDAGRREITVDAEGWAPLEGTDTLSARHRALAEAQKKAVEKAVGVTVRARTRVDDAVSVTQSIEANMGGTIGRYEVTSEGEQGGFFKVAIHAVVIYQPLPSASAERRPSRVSVRISSARVAAAVRTALASRDVELSEDEADADIVVTGVVETRGLDDPRLGGFYSYTAKVSLTAANLRTGKVSQADLEASAVDTDERAACDRALEEAGDGSGAALASALENTVPAGPSEPPELARAKAALADLPMP